MEINIENTSQKNFKNLVKRAYSYVDTIRLLNVTNCGISLGI